MVNSEVDKVEKKGDRGGGKEKYRTEMNKRWRQTDGIEEVAEVSERAAGTIRFSVGSRFLFLPLPAVVIESGVMQCC